MLRRRPHHPKMRAVALQQPRTSCLCRGITPPAISFEGMRVRAVTWSVNAIYSMSVDSGPHSLIGSFGTVAIDPMDPPTGQDPG